jgi:hypothetical protein
MNVLAEALANNTDILRDALKQNRLATVRRMMKKKDYWFDRVLQGMDYNQHSVEMAQMLATEMTDETWKRWGFYKGRNEVLRELFQRSVSAGNAAVADVYISNIANFNSGGGYRHEIVTVAQSALDDRQKTAYARRIVAGGFDQVKEGAELLRYVVGAGSVEVFDIASAALGIDLHKDNEALLRHAAASGKKDMARHLVTAHQANLAVAITTARTMGQDAHWQLLEELRQEIAPHEQAPPTIESLSAELQALRAEMKEMRDELTALRSPVRVDKPVLSVPALKTP